MFKNTVDWMLQKVREHWHGTSQQSFQSLLLSYKSYPKSSKQHKKLKQAVLSKLRKPDAKRRLNTCLKKIDKFPGKKCESFEKPLELVCPICIDFFVKPVITPCGHTFCHSCVDDAILFSRVCPVCRSSIRGMELTVCKGLSQIIERYLQKLGNSELLSGYQNKVKGFESWLDAKSLNLDNLQQKDVIDVRDTEYIWCKAIINQIFERDGQIQSILVHYLGWNTFYDEVISVNSPRLAPHRHYTSRTDIPHYHTHHEQEDSMYSYVIMDYNYHLSGPPNILQQMQNGDIQIQFPLVENGQINFQIQIGQENHLFANRATETIRDPVYLPLTQMLLNNDQWGQRPQLQHSQLQRSQLQRPQLQRLQQEQSFRQPNRETHQQSPQKQQSEGLQQWGAQQERQRDIHLGNQRFFQRLLSLTSQQRINAPYNSIRNSQGNFTSEEKQQTSNAEKPFQVKNEQKKEDRRSHLDEIDGQDNRQQGE